MRWSQRRILRCRSARGTAAALLTLVLGAPGWAQEASSAPQRYSEHLRPRPQVRGLTPEQAAELNDGVAAIAAVLRANPAIRRAPEGFCTRVLSFVEEVASRPARASVGVQFPVIVGGRCRDSMAGGVAINVNSPAALLGPPIRLDGVAEDDGASSFHAMPRPLPARDGWSQYQVADDRVLVLTRRTEPLFLPVSRERFLRALERSFQYSLESIRRSQTEKEASLRKLAQANPVVAESLPKLQAAGQRAIKAAAERVESIRRARATLSPDALAAQACFTLVVKEAVAPAPRCANGPPLVGPNPRFFDPALSPGALQLLTMHVRSAPSPVVSTATFEKAWEIWGALDLPALAAVLR